jgi:mitofilin
MCKRQYCELRSLPSFFLTLVSQRLQTTNTPVDKPRRSHALTGVLVIGSIAAFSYGGAVYYSLKDKEFRKVFVQHVPGAEYAVRHVHDMKQNADLPTYNRQAASIMKQAEEYGEMVKNYTNKAKEASSSAVDYLKDAYGKLSGQKEIPKLPSQTPSLQFEKQVQPKVEQSVEDSVDKDAIQTEKLGADIGPLEAKVETIKPLPLKVIEPIVLSDITLEHTQIEQLRHVVEDLTDLLNESKLSDEGRGAIEDADQQLLAIDQKLSRLLEQHHDILQSTTRASEKLEALRHIFNIINEGYTEKICVAQKYTEDQIEQKSNELSEIFFQERAAMVAEFNAKLTKQMEEERSKFIEEKTSQLDVQNKEQEKSYSRQVQKRVEVEGGGRFGGLDNLIARLAVLEKYAYEASLLIDKSSFSHRLAVAISALDRATDKEYTQPFSNELSALRNIASTATGTERQLMDTVLYSIPAGLEHEGVQSMAELRKRFDYLAEEVRQSALVSPNGGMFSHMISITLSKLMFKKHGLVPGEDIEARLARAEYYLKENDLDSAAREMNQLQGWPKKLASGWVDDARKRLEVKQVVKVMLDCLESLIIRCSI